MTSLFDCNRSVPLNLRVDLNRYLTRSLWVSRFVADCNHDRMDKSDTSDVEFREIVHRIEVNGESYQYKLTCIDLDPKKIVSVPMYLKKDRAIVDHYLAVVGERELSCGRT